MKPADTDPLPPLPLTVHVDPLYCHLTRVHQWDDPGWLPKTVEFIRAMGFLHRGDGQPKEREV